MQVDTQMIKAIVEDAETEKSELYRLIGEGYQAMKDGRTSTIDEVRKKVKTRRERRGAGALYPTSRV